MAITNMLFLFCFFPIALAIYYMVRDEIKEYVLLAVSLFFYAFGSLPYFTLFLILVFITVLLGRGIHSSESPALRKLLLIAGIVINAGALCYYKYTDFAILNLNRVFGTTIAFQNRLLPLGISFFTFKAISYLVDIYKREAVPTMNLGGGT